MPVPTKIIEDIPLDREKIMLGLVGLLTLIATCAVLSAAKDVFMPLVIAWLLSYILWPVVDTMIRRKIPLGLAVAVVIFMVLAVCYLGTIFLQARVLAFADKFPDYHGQLITLTNELAEQFDAPAEYIYAIDWGDQVRQQLQKFAGPLIGFFTKLLLVLIFLLFMLLSKPYFRDKLDRAFAREDSERVATVTQSIATQISQYLGIQFLISAATGVLVWYSLSLLGVDFPVTWGALAFLLNFIPTIGSIIASIPPILLALVQFYPSWFEASATFLCILTIQVIMGNILTPKVMGDRLNLSPVIVLISLVFWGWLWGPMGALLSIPIAAAIRIVCANIEPLHAIATLMGSGKRYRSMAKNEPEATEPT